MTKIAKVATVAITMRDEFARMLADRGGKAAGGFERRFLDVRIAYALFFT